MFGVAPVEGGSKPISQTQDCSVVGVVLCEWECDRSLLSVIETRRSVKPTLSYFGRSGSARCLAVKLALPSPGPDPIYGALTDLIFA